MKKYLAPLSVAFVWHPADENVIHPIIEYCFSLLSRDIDKPFSRSMNLPIFLGSTYKKGVPRKLEVVSAKTVAFIFVSKHIVADDSWVAYINSMPQDENFHIIPIAMDKTAFNLKGTFDSINFIRAYEFKVPFLNELSFVAIAHEIYRYALNDSTEIENLGKDKALKIFLSHAKDGNKGVKIAKALKNFIDNSLMRKFFDATDIAPGYKFDEEIIGHIKDSSIVAIHSDIYSSRYWCQRELLSAKEFERPIVAVDILEEFEDRRFPFSTNVPTVHVQFDDEPLEKDLLRILISVLLETVRFFYTKLLFEQYKKIGWIENDAKICPRPPELSNIEKILIQDKGNITSKYKSIVYPEPPLYVEELSFFKKIGIDIKTPLASNDFLLSGKSIGISISEPSKEELIEIGKNSNHLMQLSQDIARYLLACDAKVIYGGDLRTGGFTEFIFHEAQVLQTRLQTMDIFIENYIAWPIYKASNDEMTDWKAKYRSVAKMIEVSPPEDVEDLISCKESYLVPKTAQNLFVWSRCLTHMRNQMIKNCDARICAGGRDSGYKGAMPGVLEEIAIAIDEEKPLYLLGGFGGITASVCEFIENGRMPENLTLKWQVLNNVGYKDFLEFALSRNPKYSVDYDSLINKLTFNNLRNGLNEEENKQLFKTSFTDEALRLIFTGLKRL